MSKKLEVTLKDKTNEILEILSKRTSRSKDDLIEEALEMLFEEYKEAILDT
ncbi:MAG: ribbon-helix-helix domain-containing protein [Candidatus Sericytochromatia bacterium]